MCFLDVVYNTFKIVCIIKDVALYLYKFKVVGAEAL